MSKRVRVGCPSGYVDNGDDCTKENPIAARYDSRTYQKLVSPASTQTVEIPAEYKTRTYQKLVSAATTEVEEIPAQYETRTYRKLVSAATTKVEEIPAQYDTRTYQKLVSAASISETDIPAEYRTVTKRQLVKKGGFSEWKEVVCDADVTAQLVRQVQLALRAQGYDPGPIDNVMGSLTRQALRKFQQEKGLPVGNLNFETLEALGVRQ